MVRRGGRRGLLLGSLAGAGALALSSSALACTVFMGKMTVVGNAGTGAAISIGNEESMSWCSGYPLGKAKATLGGSITVTVKKAGIHATDPSSRTPPAPAGAEPCKRADGSLVPGSSRLLAGSYAVNFYNGENPTGFVRAGKTDTENYDGTRNWSFDCMSNTTGFPQPPAVRLGTMTVDEFGKGTGTFTLPSSGRISGPLDEAAVCVTDLRDAFRGNQVPLTII